MELLAELIVPIGIATYIILLITLLLGAGIIKAKRKIHKIFGIATFICATFHFLIIIYLENFNN